MSIKSCATISCRNNCSLYYGGYENNGRVDELLITAGFHCYISPILQTRYLIPILTV